MLQHRHSQVQYQYLLLQQADFSILVKDGFEGILQSRVGGVGVLGLLASQLLQLALCFILVSLCLLLALDSLLPDLLRLSVLCSGCFNSPGSSLSSGLSCLQVCPYLCNLPCYIPAAGFFSYYKGVCVLELGMKACKQGCLYLRNLPCYIPAAGFSHVTRGSVCWRWD